MLFTAPIWLLGLFPWVAVTLWLLWGRPRRQSVPFLPLWQGPLGSQRTRRSMRTPPLALAAAILAMLLALLSAARPVARTHGGTAITILVDRGVSMSASGGHRPRFVDLAQFLKQPLLDRFGPGRVYLVDLLTGQRRDSDREAWPGVVAALPRTAVDISQSLLAAVAGELSRGSGPVILLSDMRVHIDDPRFTQIFPPPPVHNVGITALAAREAPAAQVMVAVRADAATSTELHVSSAGRDVSQRINFPAAGTEVLSFVDLPSLGDMIEARLVGEDDSEPDHAAWLVREGRPQRVEVRSEVPESLRRMIGVYTKSRPPREDSPIVAVVNRAADLQSGDAGVIIETPAASAKKSGEPRVTSDPITALVNWAEVTRNASVASVPPSGWTPLVSAGDRVLVARRDSPARQVWVGFDSPQWPRSVDYVVFWTNVFDWCGGAGMEFAAHPVTVAPESWKRQVAAPQGMQPNAWPGVFQRPDGSLIAMNATDLRFPPPGHALSLPPRDAQGNAKWEISSWALLGGLICLLASAMTWRRSGALSRA